MYPRSTITIPHPTPGWFEQGVCLDFRWRALAISLGTFFGAALLLGACAGSHQRGSGSQTASQFAIGPTLSDAGMHVEAYDINHDGQPNYWALYDRKGGRLVRDRRDINFNGQVDIWRFFDRQGQLIREEMDLDFDGDVDLVNHYEGDQLVRQEQSMTFSGTVTIRKRYRNGRLVTIEHDTRGDGRMDTWEFYEQGKLIRIGRDTTGDGKEDHFVEPSHALLRHAPPIPGKETADNKTDEMEHDRIE